MDYSVMILKTVFMYVLILSLFRMMGKREIGELGVLDLVVFIMIAEMAVMSIEDPEKPLLYTVVPMGVLALIQVLFAFISLKSQTLREFIDGKPSILINKGIIDEEMMRKQRYNLDDLLLQLREKNIKAVSDVEFAILEPSGKLSVFEKEKNKAGMKSLVYPFPLIMDGRIQKMQLERLNKTSDWLNDELRKRGYPKATSIFFCAQNDDGSFYIIEKNKNKEA